jgi:hypothetical protein
MCKITIDARTSGVREGDIIEVGIVAALLFVLSLIALGT